MSGSLTRLNPASLPDTSRMGYSQISISEAGRTAYVSGQVALDGSGFVPENLADQTKLVVRNLQADRRGSHRAST